MCSLWNVLVRSTGTYAIILKHCLCQVICRFEVMHLLTYLFLFYFVPVHSHPKHLPQLGMWLCIPIVICDIELLTLHKDVHEQSHDDHRRIELSVYKVVVDTCQLKVWHKLSSEFSQTYVFQQQVIAHPKSLPIAKFEYLNPSWVGWGTCL